MDEEYREVKTLIPNGRGGVPRRPLKASRQRTTCPLPATTG